ncbi:MAG: hypothetical protein V5B32_13905 [Candidatus Accumulibacter sp. UW26]|jgi:hypothetical protein
MSAVAESPQPLPLTEGIGIFVGVVAWDILSAGEMELLKASLIATAGALTWYGVRYWWRINGRKRR